MTRDGSGASFSIAIAAAGTGGHVYPGLAVGEALVDQGVDQSDILYVGGARLEATVYPGAGFPFGSVELRGLERRLTARNLGIPRVVIGAVRTIHAELAAPPDGLPLPGAHDVAIVLAGDSEYPLIADATASFVYARIMGTVEEEPLGYSAAALDRWAERVRTWAAGGVPSDLAHVGAPDSGGARDVFVYVISGYKERNPQAAVALIERLG